METIMTALVSVSSQNLGLKNMDAKHLEISSYECIKQFTLANVAYKILILD